jgi:hypothetical protein
MSDIVKVTFDFAGDLPAKVQEVTQGITGMRDKSAEALAIMSKNASEYVERLAIQKKVLAELEAQYKHAKAEFDKVNVSGYGTGHDAARQAAKKLLNDTRAELDAEKRGLVELEKEYSVLQKEIVKTQKKTEEAASKQTGRQTTALTQMRQIREEMARLTNADGTVSTQNLARYDALKNKLAEVGTAYRRTREEQKQLTTGGSTMAGLASGISGIAGAFSAATGASSLFIKDNEKLAAIQTKLQAVMAITIGLQQVSVTLHATSAFRINTVARVTALWRAAQTALNTQLGISLVLTKGLMAGGIGLLIWGVAELVGAFKRWNKEQNEARQIQRESLKSVQDEIVSVKSLEAVLKNSNNAYEVRKSALDKLRETMPGYNAMLTKEGELIGDNTGALKKYIEQVKNAELAKAYAKKLAEAQMAYDDFVASEDNRPGEQRYAQLKRGAQGRTNKAGGGTEERVRVMSAKERELLKTVQMYEKALGKYQTELLKTEAPQDGTKAYWEAQQKSAQLALSAMKDAEKGTEKWEAAVKQYNDASKKLELWDIAKTTKNAITENQVAAETAERLRKIDEARQKIADSEREREIEITQERINNMKDGTDKTIAQIELDYDRRENEIIKKGRELIKAQHDIEHDAWLAANPDWKKKGMTFAASTTTVAQLPTQQVDYLAERFKLNEETKNKALSDLQKKRFKEFEDLEAKRLRITQEYNDKITELERDRTAANSADTDRAIAEAKRLMAAELGALGAEMLKASDFYQKLFEDLSRKGYSTLKTFSEGVKDVLASAKDVKDASGKSMVAIEIPVVGDDGQTVKKAVNVTIEEFIRLKEKSEEITNHLNKKNPFKGIASSFSTLVNIAKGKTNAETKMEDLSNAVEALEAHVKDAKSLMLNWSDSLGGIFGDGVGEAFAEITELADGIAGVGIGIGKMAGGDMIGGITSALGGVAAVVQVIAGWEEKRLAYQQKMLLGQIEYGRLLREQEYDLIGTVGQVKALKDNVEALNWLIAHGYIDNSGKADVWSVISEQYAQRNDAINEEIKNYETMLAELQNRRWDTGWQSSGSLSWTKDSGSIGTLLKGQSPEKIEETLALLDAQGKLQGSTKELYDEWKASGENIGVLRDEIAELYEQMEEFVTGQSFDSFLDGAMSAISDMRNGIGELADFTEDALTKAIISSFKYKVLADALQPYYTALSEQFLSDKGIDKAWADDWKHRLEQELGANVEALNGVFDTLGIDIAGATREASQKGIASISQDSADSIDGKFSTMLIYEDKSLQVATDIRAFITSGLGKLDEIAQNTAYCKRLKEVDENIARLYKSVDGIVREGLLLKKTS